MARLREGRGVLGKLTRAHHGQGGKAARDGLRRPIAGVQDKGMELMDRLSCDDVDALIKDETITGGVIPKGEFTCA